MARSLYICYFGAREPLVQTQVIPYLRELVKGGNEIILLTFEPARVLRARNSAPEVPPRKTDDAIRRDLGADGIEWHTLKYHKQPSFFATSYDILRGVIFVRSIARKRKIDILHGRSHVATLIGAIARKSFKRAKLLFDIRGFFPDEYADAGIWPAGGWLYRVVKRVEKWLLKEADGFVVLTERARDILFPGAEESGHDEFGRPVEVIPCCVDLSRFATANADARRNMRIDLGVNGRFVAAYVGAFGGWYLTAETAEFFGALKRRHEDAFALILSQSDPNVIEPLLRTNGYGPGDYLITQVTPADLPLYLCAADFAVSFIKKCYSKLASSPTKNAEYLACGLPIIANEGVGDVDSLIESNSVGALVRGFSEKEYLQALDEAGELHDVSTRCRNTAKRLFDLEHVGGDRYRRVYRRLLDEVKL